MQSTIEWGMEFLKNKDIFKKEITNSTISDTSAKITKKQSIEYLVTEEEFLKDSKPFDSASRIWVIFNKQKSTPSTITTNWNKLLKPNVWIVVVDTKNNSKWLLHPETHMKVVEEKELQKSLETLQSNS